MFSLLSSRLALLATLFFSSVTYADSGISPQERLELGQRYARRGNYIKALEAFNRIRNYHRDSPISIEAELAIADLYYKQGEYEQARYAYHDFARLHPRHPELARVQFRQGLSVYKRAPKVAGRDQNGTRKALKIWSHFQTDFPNSEYVVDVQKYTTDGTERLAKAELIVATFYAKRGAWAAARRRAEGLVQSYPSSQSVPTALLIAGKGAHHWGDIYGAKHLRSQLAEHPSSSKELATLDRLLTTKPGTPPADELFARPYRLSGGGAAAQAPPTQQPKR